MGTYIFFDLSVYVFVYLDMQKIYGVPVCKIFINMQLVIIDEINQKH